ncbi:MAG: hypothetical protein M1365_03730 [Actinobacteria bacterium]|nr:hypothetical protein [Actinomycetota bacterium]
MIKELTPQTAPGTGITQKIEVTPDGSTITITVLPPDAEQEAKNEKLSHRIWNMQPRQARHRK